MHSYNTGGLISVMALGSLFILITKHGLEYPDFYNKLYALLEPSIFVARYRSRFFEVWIGFSREGEGEVRCTAVLQFNLSSHLILCE